MVNCGSLSEYGVEGCFGGWWEAKKNWDKVGLTGIRWDGLRPEGRVGERRQWRGGSDGMSKSRREAGAAACEDGSRR